MVYNCKIIEYDDYIHIQHYDVPISRIDYPKQEQEKIDTFNDEAIKNDLQIPQEIDPDPEKQKHNLSVSVNRSKNNMFRIARSNNWDMFATFTFDRTITDSSDYNLVSKRITTFFNNIRKNHCPDLKYLVVPELHKDKEHYHFHALISNADNLELKDSGKYDSLGSKIFNIKNWKWGFSTLVFIQDQARVKNYIGKYITKDLMNKLKYKKRYYCSQNVEIKKEEFGHTTLDHLIECYGDNISFIKTVTVNGINRIHYLEIKKTIDKIN